MTTLAKPVAHLPVPMADIKQIPVSPAAVCRVPSNRPVIGRFPDWQSLEWLKYITNWFLRGVASRLAASVSVFRTSGELADNRVDQCLWSARQKYKV